jgi:hypothetical protein
VCCHWEPRFYLSKPSSKQSKMKKGFRTCMLLNAVTLNLTVIGHADDVTEWNQIMIDALRLDGLPAGGSIRVAAKLVDSPSHTKETCTDAWRFWTFDWGTPASGEHQVTSRVFDVDRNIQPAPNDPFLDSRRTFWVANGQIARRVLIL